MKFKYNTLNEGFEYSQWALNDARDIIEKLEGFILDANLIVNRADHMTDEDLAKLSTAVDVLSEFVESYDVYATRQANNFNRERRK